MELGKIEQYKIYCNEIHKNKYDYSLIIDVKNARDKIPIICSKHGIFYQRADHHKDGHGCPICNISKLELQV